LDRHIGEAVQGYLRFPAWTSSYATATLGDLGAISFLEVRSASYLVNPVQPPSIQLAPIRSLRYNIDGGGSSTMYFNGGLVNNPLGENKERGTSDILYIAQ